MAWLLCGLSFLSFSIECYTDGGGTKDEPSNKMMLIIKGLSIYTIQHSGFGLDLGLRSSAALLP